MIVIDIGNTNIVIGTFYNKKINKITRIDCKNINLINNIKKIFSSKNIPKLKIDRKICIISSVSTYFTKEIINIFKMVNFKILNINLNNISNKIKFKYKANELGADRIANTFSAINKYGKNLIVVDFGTATTFDLIIKGIYEGGLIAPGINISHDALVNNAFKLKKISIIPVKKLIGINTKHSMQSGFYYGYLSLIDGILKKIIIEKKIKPKIVITGGLAEIFLKELEFKTYYDPNLTLHGLYLIGMQKYA